MTVMKRCVDLVFKIGKLRRLLEPHIFNEIAFKFMLVWYMFKIAIPSVRIWTLSWTGFIMLLWIFAWQAVSIGSFCIFKITKRVR